MTITNENDEAYANAAFINNSEDIVADWIKKAEHFRIKRLESGTAEIDISYGASNRQKFDIFQKAADSNKDAVLCQAEVDGKWHAPLFFCF